MGHGHGHGHGHEYGPDQPAPEQRAAYRNRLATAFLIALVYFVVEAVFALLTGSLVLMADAAHMLTDTVGLGLAFGAIVAVSRGARSPQHTFGLYRMEVLAALANAALLFLVAIYIVWHAVHRFDDSVHLPTHQLIFVALIGLAANLGCFLLLRQGAKDNINMRAAYLEVVADALGSVAVLVAALLIVAFGWTWVDPVFALALAAFIVPRTLRLGGHAVRVLLQAAPRGVDCARIEADLRGLPGVHDVTDLHVWTLSPGMDVATAHLHVTAETSEKDVLRRAESVLRERYGLAHSTLQIEVDAPDEIAARWCAARQASERALVPPARGRHRRVGQW